MGLRDAPTPPLPASAPAPATSPGRRRFQRAGLLSSAQLARLRLRRGRALLLASVAIGILAAILLVSIVPLYSTLVDDIHIQSQVRSAPPATRNFEIRVTSSATTANGAEQIASAVAPLAQHYLARFSGVSPNASSSSLSTDQGDLVKIGSTTLDPAFSRVPLADLQAFDYAQAAPHMRLLAGSFPSAAGGTAPYPVLITSEMATFEHLKVGDALGLQSISNHTRTVSLRVVGIWQTIDANDNYWNGAAFTNAAIENSKSFGPNPPPPVYPLLVSRNALFGALSQTSGLSLTQHWVYYTDPTRLTAQNAPQVDTAMTQLQSRLDGQLSSLKPVEATSILTGLNNLLDDDTQQQQVLALPLYILVAQLLGLALLFVGTLAGLLIDAQAQDIATLNSRGVSSVQILGTFASQGVLLALGGIVLGPVLAVALSILLALGMLHQPSLASAGLTPAYLRQVFTLQSVILPALAGALLGVATLAGAAWQAGRLDVLTFRREQGRSTRQPFWRRYYLDVALAVVCVLGYSELAQYGTTSTRVQLAASGAATTSSPLLLLTPALLLLAGALLLLRALPGVLGWGEWVAARGRGATSVMAFAQLQRNATRYARLALLLVLAVGLGFFALTFNASLQRNTYDRLAYATGSDVRVTEKGVAGDAQSAQRAQAYARLP